MSLNDRGYGLSSLSISVVIPLYNGERFIEQALASVYSQTRLPTEIVVVDDHSTDQGLDLVRRLANEAPLPVRVHQLPANSGGPSAPINYGVDKAVGDFIAVLDQDDLFADEKLQTQAAMLQRWPEVTIAAGPAEITGVGTPLVVSSALPAPIQKYAVPEEGNWVIKHNASEVLLKSGMFLIGYPSFMFRKADWEKVGRVDENYRIVGDFDFVCRLSTLGGIAWAEQTAYVRRNHDANLSGNRVEMYLEDILVRRNAVQRAEPGDRSAFRAQTVEHCFWVARGFREGGFYREAMQMLAHARQLDACRRRVWKQTGFVYAHRLLCSLRLRKQQPSGITRAPWLADPATGQ